MNRSDSFVSESVEAPRDEASKNSPENKGKEAGFTPKPESEDENETPRHPEWASFVDERERVSRCIFGKARLMPSGCIELPTSNRRDSGDPTYPRLRFGRDVLQVSRAVYAIFNGQITSAVQVCHTCDNPRCINPCHLVAGNIQTNMMDMVEKEHGSHQKLRNEDVLAMRDMREDGSPMWELATLFGVCVGTVYDVCSGDTWKHLPTRGDDAA
jgi:hypothetical protein